MLDTSATLVLHLQRRWTLTALFSSLSKEEDEEEDEGEEREGEGVFMFMVTSHSRTHSSLPAVRTKISSLVVSLRVNIAHAVTALACARGSRIGG